MKRGEEHLVCKLRKALYGLKQAPRAWYSRIDHHLKELGYIKSDSEHTLYRKEGKDDEVLLIILYVDDIVYTSSSSTLLEQFKLDMMNTFNMSDMGLMSYFLGLEVK